MPALPLKCSIRDIPRRLHTGARQPAVVARDDNLFMRHPPLPAGESYHLEIPQHKCLEDQSANSEKLNVPNGVPQDVLYNTKHGRHHTSWQIARLPVGEILGLRIPNANTLRLNIDGTVKQQADVFSFEVIHEPDPCMYPHCVIYALKNGKRPKEVASGIRSEIRAEFARIAESNRQQMLQYKWHGERNLCSLLCHSLRLALARVIRPLLKALGMRARAGRMD
jgi:hypothetical protein